MQIQIFKTLENRTWIDRQPRLTKWSVYFFGATDKYFFNKLAQKFEGDLYNIDDDDQRAFRLEYLAGREWFRLYAPKFCKWMKETNLKCSFTATDRMNKQGEVQYMVEPTMVQFTTQMNQAMFYGVMFQHGDHGDLMMKLSYPKFGEDYELSNLQA